MHRQLEASLTMNTSKELNIPFDVCHLEINSISFCLMENIFHLFSFPEFFFFNKKKPGNRINMSVILCLFLNCLLIFIYFFEPTWKLFSNNFILFLCSYGLILFLMFSPEILRNFWHNYDF